MNEKEMNDTRDIRIPIDVWIKGMVKKYDLKPCPFCGSEMVFPCNGENFSFLSIVCADCEGAGPLIRDDVPNSRYEAAKLWNMRK